MRGWVFVVVPALLGSVGCSEVCGSPDQLNGRVFSSFAHARTFELVGDEAAFPALSSPANGTVEIGFEWASNLSMGPLAITMDGQLFDDGSGQWSQVNCGNFTATWGGTYTAKEGEEKGAEHTFVAAGFFVQYDDQLEGFVDWEERWESVDGRSGSFSGDILLRGEEVDP
ncbi:MAG: hypothetical protein AAGA48_15310 [Myxococcota bacterium]